ncbi:YdcK family protein [Atlantibacter hermannii]|uniref:YdcK family protein n=1 Tax=Atlantibacter hermannii TaxID=565 RepID=UPI0011CEA739|nr:YdcK family protein [Atlantibacter hermannii]
MEKYRLTDASRTVEYQENGTTHKFTVRQIEAVRDFSDVKAGDLGGWIEEETSLSHDGHCWLYDQNSAVFAGATLRDNARVTQPCTISHGASLTGECWVDRADISHDAFIGDRAMVQASVVRGECRIFGDARVMHQSQVIAAVGLTQDQDQRLQIYDSATVIASRIVHQAQIYGRALVSFAFVEHRATICEDAILEGNDKNNIWVCDCAQIYGQARIVAGSAIDQCPTIRYSSQVFGNAVIEGDCVLKHHVHVYDNAHITGGPVQLDDRVKVCGNARITGNVVIENQVEVTDHAVIEASEGDMLHIRGAKMVNGEQYITRTPVLGAI